MTMPSIRSPLDLSDKTRRILDELSRRQSQADRSEGLRDLVIHGGANMEDSLRDRARDVRTQDTQTPEGTPDIPGGVVDPVHFSVTSPPVMACNSKHIVEV
jgi:hypothetical protein